METVIHDNVLRGSPIMSFGEPPRRYRALKLLALLAGSFLVLALSLAFVAWVTMKLPLPESPLVAAVVRSSVTMPGNIPQVWREARDMNDPMPTLLGYARNPETGEPVPFAVTFPSLFDGATYSSGRWNLLTDQDLKAAEYLPMSKIYGKLLGFPTSHDVWLTVYAKNLLDSEGALSGLPQIIQGEVKDRIWHTDLSSEGLSGLDSLQLGQNAIPLTAENSLIAGSAAVLQGITLNLPETGVLNWVNTATGTRLEPKSMNSQNTTGESDLAVANGLFGYRQKFLEDQTPYYMLTFPDSSTRTFSGVDVPNTVSRPVISPSSASSLACPGQLLALFDTTSVSNICSWLGVCWEKPKTVIFTHINNRVDICFGL